MRNAKHTSIDELKTMLDISRYKNFNDILRDYPQISKDISDVEFGTDEFFYDPEDANVSEKELLGYNQMDNGLSYIGLLVGDKWEQDLFLIIYYDGDSLRAYVPKEGNTFNCVLATAFGYEDQTKIKQLTEDNIRTLKDMYGVTLDITLLKRKLSIKDRDDLGYHLMTIPRIKRNTLYYKQNNSLILLNIKENIKIVKVPVIQLREFHDGTWSIVARIHNPQKKYYEHPTLVNLDRKTVEKEYKEIMKDLPTYSEIEDNWELYMT